MQTRHSRFFDNLLFIFTLSFMHCDR
jgi:hypothetical protein